MWALPFLTALCPSERYPLYAAKGRRHQSLLERARGLVGQARRWLPGRVLILGADSGFAALELLAWCQRLAEPVTLITRLRLDAALFAPAPARAPGAKGRPPLKGARLPTLARRLTQSTTRWKKARVSWYGGARRWVEVATDTAVWYHSGLAPVSLRWVLLRDPKGKFASQALLSTDPSLSASEIINAFVRRWSMETTFQDKAPLGFVRASASGRTSPSHARPRCAWRSSPWLPSSCRVNPPGRPACGRRRGTKRRSPPSVTRSPKCAAPSGGKWLFACHRKTPTTKNHRPISSRTSGKSSLMPPDFG